MYNNTLQRDYDVDDGSGGGDGDGGEMNKNRNEIYVIYLSYVMYGKPKPHCFVGACKGT